MLEDVEMGVFIDVVEGAGERSESDEGGPDGGR